MADSAHPTVDDLTDRATAMRDMLRHTQGDCETARRITDEADEGFERAGLYRILQPRMFGGYEMGLPEFLQVMVEVARGCPSCGWVLALTSGHAHTLAYFSREVQAGLYGSDGRVRIPLVATPLRGTARPLEDGTFLIDGKWDYASGIDIATHFMCTAIVPDAPSGTVPEVMLALLDRDQFEIEDNWYPTGLRGTGSKRVVVRGAVVRAERCVAGTGSRAPGGHEGALFSGRATSLLMSEIAAVAVGIAWAAIDEYEAIARDRRIYHRPFVLRTEHHEYQRYVGEAWALTETAEAALFDAGRRYMAYARRAASGAAPFSDELDYRLLLIYQQCARLAGDAVDLLFRTQGTRGTRTGRGIERYFRDMGELQTHGGMQAGRTTEQFARVHFGMPAIAG